MKLKNKQQLYRIGILCLLLSSLLTAISQVFYANKVQNIHPFIFTGVSFFITTLYFQLFSFKEKRPAKWKLATPILIKLNLSSILAFMLFYFALKYIEPSIVNSLEMGIGPILALLILLKNKQTIQSNQWVLAIGILAVCLFFIWIILSGNSAISTWHAFSILAIIASILCGLGAVLCTHYSKKLSDLGWTSSMILSKRFYGIIILSFLTNYKDFFSYISENFLWILLVTMLGVLLPMYLLQKGIQYCEPFVVMMSLCYIAVFTQFFQLFDDRLSWSYASFVGVILLFLLATLSMINEQRQQFIETKKQAPSRDLIR